MDDLTPDADPDQAEEEEDSDPEIKELESKNKCSKCLKDCNAQEYFSTCALKNALKVF